MPESHNDIYLGIDGGGTKTHAVLVDTSGVIVGEGFAAGSNYHSVGITAACDNIFTAVSSAYGALGSGVQQSAGAFLGMAGVISDVDKNTLRSIALDLDLAHADHITIDHDLRIALASGENPNEGMVLIAGTGSSCYGRTMDGSEWRAGGWGHVLDDGGGGYWMGLQGIVAVTRAADLRGEPTSLTDTIMSALQIDDLRDVLGVLHESDDMKARVSALAPLVLDAFANGDVPATIIVLDGAHQLAIMVEAVVIALEWMGKESVPLVLSGGLIQQGSTYRSIVESVIAERAANVVPIDPLRSAAHAAALLALRSM